VTAPILPILSMKAKNLVTYSALTVVLVALAGLGYLIDYNALHNQLDHPRRGVIGSYLRSTEANPVSQHLN
jgi:hypothetical protein